MADKGIIFSAPMVLALLEGRKTQTRRLLRHPEYYGCPTGDCPHDKQTECKAAMAALTAKETGFAIGDRLYVRESLGWNRGGDDRFFYRADNCDVPAACIPEGFQIHNTHAPGMHMPRWASRLTLIVTNVRVQCLQDISEKDAQAEGAFPEFEVDIATFVNRSFDAHKDSSHYLGFKHIWNSLYEKPGQRWQDNPWIVAVDFIVEHRNINRSP